MADQLLQQLRESPTAHHVVKWWTTRLDSADFVKLTDDSAFSPELFSAGYLSAGGALVAWRNAGHLNEAGVRIVGAHTDSPGLHLKPRQGRASANQAMLDVEVYGGPLLSSWADRDLRVAGRALLRDGTTQLFVSSHPIARISLLAIHLDREVNERGLVLDRHLHLSPMWGHQTLDFMQWLADHIAVDVSDIVSWSAELVDDQQPAFLGANQEYIASSRLDNQVSCWSAMSALESSTTAFPSMVVLFDHEEVGSSSTTGASGPLLENVLERLSIAVNGTRNDFLRMLRRSHCLSADNSHALHPNYPERHHDLHAPVLNGGVAVKTNVNQRYASSAESLRPVLHAFEHLNTKPQWFSSKNSIPCGSTIGPLTATRLGIETVDVGIPQLSMHSIREVCGRHDVVALRDLIAAYFLR